MLNAIYCEFLKLKKSHFYLGLILIASFIPIALFITHCVNGEHLTWNSYFFEVEQLYFVYFSLAMSSLISAYIFTKEFSYKTISSLFCYPVNRVKIFFSKLVVILISTILLFFLQFSLTTLANFFNTQEAFTFKILYNHLIIYFYHLLSLCSILPIAILIALLCKNIVLPIIYGFIISVFNMIALFTFSQNLRNYVPTFHPLLAFANSINDNRGNIVVTLSKMPLSTSSLITDLIFFIVGIYFCILYYCKCEVK